MAAPVTVRHSFEADDRPVVLLSQREATAIRDALSESSVGFFLTKHEDSGGDDLGRAWRVLQRQIAYLESPVHGSGRPRVA